MIHNDLALREFVYSKSRRNWTNKSPACSGVSSDSSSLASVSVPASAAGGPNLHARDGFSHEYDDEAILSNDLQRILRPIWLQEFAAVAAAEAAAEAAAVDDDDDSDGDDDGDDDNACS